MNLKKKELPLELLVMLVCVLLILPSASRAESTPTKIDKVPLENKGLADGTTGDLQQSAIVQATQLGGRKLVSIVPSTPSITLEVGGPFVPRRPLKFGPWTASGQFGLKVQSIMPLWGVMLEAGPLEGPRGALPPERLWVQAEATEGEFQSLAHAVPIVVGDLRTPTKEVLATLKVEPSWTDPPGKYEGELLMRPFAPGGAGPPPSPDLGNVSSEHVAPMTINFEIDCYISVTVSGGELIFRASSGAGDYTAEEDIHFRVVTNAQSWRVDCQATPLTCGDSEIPLERIFWERLDLPVGGPIRGNLRDNPTVLQGQGPTAGFATGLRFTIRVTMGDTPGDYTGSMSLVGFTEP